MFEGATSFNHNIAPWNTDKVTSMSVSLFSLQTIISQVLNERKMDLLMIPFHIWYYHDIIIFSKMLWNYLMYVWIGSFYIIRSLVSTSAVLYYLSEVYIILSIDVVQGAIIHCQHILLLASASARPDVST